jgi:DNA-binding LacI/PurR family transcriptional regulator
VAGLVLTDFKRRIRIPQRAGLLQLGEGFSYRCFAMKTLRRLAIAEQTANHLVEGMCVGRWGETLPGVNRLAMELDVSRETIRAALQQLETQGYLSSRGHGRSRMIVAPGERRKSGRALRVAVLLHDPLIDENGSMQRLLLQLQRDIEAAGHACIFSAKCQVDLHHDLRRITAHVGKTPADAWVVIGGSLELLQWFSSRPLPAIALGGRCIGVPIASVGLDTLSAVADGVRMLHRLGHRRIVFIAPGEWRRLPVARVIQTFTAELAAHGVAPSPYHVPDWEETPEGIRSLLASLFRVTPPTALIIEDPKWVVGALAFLAERGLRVPTHVSLVCSSFEPSLTWHHPALAHFHWSVELLVRRVARWIGAVTRSREDRNFVTYPVAFAHGGSIGPAPK